MDFDLRLSLQFLASRVSWEQKTPLGMPYPNLGHNCFFFTCSWTKVLFMQDVLSIYTSLLLDDELRMTLLSWKASGLLKNGLLDSGPTTNHKMCRWGQTKGKATKLWKARPQGQTIQEWLDYACLRWSSASQQQISQWTLIMDNFIFYYLELSKLYIAHLTHFDINLST